MLLWFDGIIIFTGFWLELSVSARCRDAAAHWCRSVTEVRNVLYVFVSCRHR